MTLQGLLVQGGTSPRAAPMKARLFVKAWAARRNGGERLTTLQMYLRANYWMAVRR